MSESELDDVMDDTFKIPNVGIIKSTDINNKIDFSFDDEMDNFHNTERNINNDINSNFPEDDEMDSDLLN